MTAVITGERGENTLTRYGLEEYVADCVIVLDHRVTDQISTRRLRVVKYRGSAHGTNEYPFLIGAHGISVMPITSMGLDHPAPTTRLSTGVPSLDEMLGGKGVYRGSSILISGTPGTGKSSLAAHFAKAACERGDKALIFAYEESSQQLLRNMRSIGLDLRKYLDSGLLQIHASRPSLQGLEQHLVTMHDVIVSFKPDVVVIDPITNLSINDRDHEIKPTLMRLIDLIKRKQITAVFTSLITGESADIETSEVGVSSLMDTWLLLRNVEENGERNRTMFVLKSRGMKHSNQVREFLMSERGIDLVDAYIGPDRVLTGTARMIQEERTEASSQLRRMKDERHRSELRNKRMALLAQIEALKSEAAGLEADSQFSAAQSAADDAAAERSLQRMATARGKKASNGKERK